MTPVEFIEQGREQVYDKEKYREMLLEATADEKAADELCCPGEAESLSSVNRRGKAAITPNTILCNCETCGGVLWPRRSSMNKLYRSQITCKEEQALHMQNEPKNIVDDLPPSDLGSA